MEFWAARDRNGDLWLFPGEPFEEDVEGRLMFTHKSPDGQDDDIDPQDIDERYLPEIKPGEKFKLIIT